MKTPMQELLEWVRATLPMDLDTPQMIEQKIESMLEKEKEQTIDFAKTCLNKAKDLDVLTAFLNVDKYYNETFNTKER
jgi:hypothetical protein